MAITITKLNATDNGPTQPIPLGPYKIAFIRVAFSGTHDYTEGTGESLDVEDLLGIRWISQVVPMFHGADSTLALVGVQPQWNAATQKLLLYTTGGAGDPAEVSSANIDAVELDLMIWGLS